MKRNLFFIIIVICVLGFNMLALAEEKYNIVHVPVDVDFETALGLCQSTYSEKSGASLDEVKKMDFTWSASPRYLVISADDQWWKRSDANWYFSLTDNIRNMYFTIDISMLQTDEKPFSILLKFDPEKYDPFEPISRMLEQEYQEEYEGIDDDTEEWEKEYGPYFLWPYEVKAMFYKKWQMTPYFHDNYVEGRLTECEAWLLPDENDAPYDIVSASARELVKESFGLSDEVFSKLYEDARFYKIVGEEPIWRIQYWMYAECGGVYFWDALCAVTVSREGEIIGYSCG